MTKNYYKYNPETDNFERIFITPTMRILRIIKFLTASFLFGAALYFVSFHWLSNNSEKSLREENARLRSQYNVLRNRLDNSMKILDNIQNRDDNFYRVMMQMEPMARSRRYAYLSNDASYRSLKDLSDESLLNFVTKRIEMLDRRIYSQSLSFDQLRDSISKNKDKLSHIPAILPLAEKNFSLSSGYGYRRDPIDSSRKFHYGIDFAAPTGTQVIAAADGVISFANRKNLSGNCVEISHAYNYETLYANLSKILVKEGQHVKRGEVIGLVGSSGKSTAPHLHYEVKYKGDAQNPINFFFMDLTPEQYSEFIRISEDAANVMD